MWYENSYGNLINMRNVNCIYIDSDFDVVAGFLNENTILLEMCENKEEAKEKLKKISRMVTSVRIVE